MSKLDRRSTAGVAVTLAALAALGLSSTPELLEEANQLLDDMQDKDEKRFLASLQGEPKRMWSRRVAKGLKRDELKYIREKMRDWK